MYGCNGRFVPDWLAEYHDRMAWRAPTYRSLLDYDTRARRYRAAEVENAVVRALVIVAGRAGNEERASFVGHFEARGDEADRLARDHAFGPDRLIAMKRLARSRGVDLEVVLRAALGGELRSIVTLPPAREKSST